MVAAGDSSYKGPSEAETRRPPEHNGGGTEDRTVGSASVRYERSLVNQGMSMGAPGGHLA